MSFIRRIAMALLCLAFLENAAQADSTNEPTGIWLTQAGDAKVQIARCGSSICATIVWLKAPIDSLTGKPQIDDKNPDPAKARRPIIGLNLFLGMKSDGSKWSGRIYNADNGKTYSSNVSLVKLIAFSYNISAFLPNLFLIPCKAVTISDGVPL